MIGSRGLQILYAITFHFEKQTKDMVSVVAKSSCDEFGEESNEPEDSDPIRDEYQENYPDGKDIAIQITQSIQESSQGACDEWIHRGPVCATIVDEGFVEDIGAEQVDIMTEYGHMHKDLDHGSSLTATDQLDVLRRQQMRATPLFQNSPLQEYIDRVCGTMSAQWYSGE